MTLNGSRYVMGAANAASLGWKTLILERFIKQTLDADFSTLAHANARDMTSAILW